MSRPIKVIVQLTQDEAYALHRAIDEYFYERIEMEASELIEQMHSKVADALIAGGYCCDDSEDRPSLN